MERTAVAGDLLHGDRVRTGEREEAEALHGLSLEHEPRQERQRDRHDSSSASVNTDSTVVPKTRAIFSAREREGT